MKLIGPLERTVTSTIRGESSEVVLREEDGMKSPCAGTRQPAVHIPPRL